MPKPHGTFLYTQRQQKLAHVARVHRTTRRLSRQDADLAAFEQALNRISQRRLQDWHRDMAALADRLKKGAPASDHDKTRQAVSEVIEQVRGMLEQVQDYRQLEGRLQVPLNHLITAPSQPGTISITLPLVIALCQILEVLVRLRRRR